MDGILYATAVTAGRSDAAHASVVYDAAGALYEPVYDDGHAATEFIVDAANVAIAGTEEVTLE